MSTDTESRAALGELIAALQNVDQRFASDEWMVTSPDDVAGAHRAMMHILQGGLASAFERDPSKPEFRKIVSAFRKFTGDNPDAIYYEAPVSADHAYIVRGNMAGSIYVSITVEAGAGDGAMPDRTSGVLNDTQFDVDDDGNFEVLVGGATPADRNYLELDPEAASLTMRYYFEEDEFVAGDENRPLNLTIETTEPTPPLAAPDDASVAAGIRRVARFVESRTIDGGPPGSRERPAFAGTSINEFPTPVPPGDHFLSFADAAYSLSPLMLGDDEALVIEGVWPECRAGYLCLWNRWQQTLDYLNRPVGLNRKQTVADADGRFRMIVAHQDPGVPNWLDTEGRNVVVGFWRFVLPTSDIVTPTVTVVPFSEVSAG